MYNCEQRASDYHQCGAFPEFVIDIAEERSEEDCAEWQHGWDETCHILVYAIFEYHKFCGEFKERKHSCVEHKAECCHIPEAAVADQHLEVGEFESFFRFCLYGFGRGVFFLVHYAVDQEGYDTDAEQCGAKTYRCMYSSARFGKRKGEGEGAGCADTRQCNLKSHSESELVSGKPFGDYLGHGDSCNFASCAVDGKSK